MNKLLIALGVASSFLFSGCAAVVQGGAHLMAEKAADHPASKHFVVAMNKNDAFNASLRSLTAKDRKVTASDRDTGVLQGEINENTVAIKIAAAGRNEAAIDVKVSFTKGFAYGEPKLQQDLDTLVAEIEKAAPAAKKVAVSESGTEEGGVVAAPKKAKKSVKKVSAPSAG